jgi:uncharacterized protein YyaL (SSP411 family)
MRDVVRPARSCAVLAALLLGAEHPRPQTPSVNRLAQSTSPYLLQHRNNPVDWYPWGEEALARAKREDKPIFLSIGYAACHWCHVMEEESFEDPATAKLMNELFVNVKVDREERPDLDEIYMAAVVRFTGGHGGWPMSVFLTPDLKPFYGGTYYPPEDRWGTPGFPRLLRHVAALWRDRRADVESAAGDLVEDLARQLAPALEPGEPSLEFTDAMAAASAERFDAEHGGFGYPPRFAPKFPHASELMVLLRHAHRRKESEGARMAAQTLSAMARGGIYDQLGGGFHRYSVDRQWHVPHFEKMLYDNALLVRVLLEARRVTGEAELGEIARETLDYMLREMADPDGGFWSSQDADSEGEEGKFFAWTRAEIDAVLGAEAGALAAERYGVTESGNWEHGKNVLFAARTPAEVASGRGADAGETSAELAAIRAKLLAARSSRVAPATDDKVLTAWNGMAIAAMALGHQAFGEPRFLIGAQRAADFALRHLVRDGRVLRSWRRGEARLNGYLEDYGFLADGLLCLFESDFDPRWLAAARDLLGQVRSRFTAADGALFVTADDHEALVARSKSVTESSVPSGAAMVALSCLRAGLLLADTELYEAGVRVLRANRDYLARAAIAAPSLLLALEFHLGDPREVVLVGEPEDAQVQAMLRKTRDAFPPHHVVALVHAANRDELKRVAPALAGMEAIGGRATAYVCRRGTCERPVTDVAELVLR